MRKRSPFLALFAVLALAAVIAGCGGGDSSSDTSSSTGGSTESSEGQSGESSGSAPTKAAFIKEADEICTNADDDLNDEVEAYAKENDIDITAEEEPSEEQQEEIYQEIVLPNIAKQSEEIAALTPPEGDESTVEDLTDALDEEVAKAEDEGGIPDDDALEGAVEKANAYGLKACGS